MMPTTMSPLLFDLPENPQSSPELRRLDMFNRARRDEVNAVMFGMNPRETIAYRRPAGQANTPSVINHLVAGMRNGIGNMLISAGHRMHTPV